VTSTSGQEEKDKKPRSTIRQITVRWSPVAEPKTPAAPTQRQSYQDTKKKRDKTSPISLANGPSHSDHPFAHLRPIIASSSSSQIPTVCQPLTPGHAAGATPQSQPLLKSCDSFATTRKCELLQRPAPNHSLKRKFRVRALKQRDGWRWAERSGVETRLPT